MMGNLGILEKNYDSMRRTKNPGIPDKDHDGEPRHLKGPQ